MLNTLTGCWINAFDSTMDLTEFDDGSISGTYRSTTGSSGTYRIVGVADTYSSGDCGRSLAISVLWRSWSLEQPDPSWHYVSGFSGQLIKLDGEPTLTLIHDLVVTVPATETVCGSYLDKLMYKRQRQEETLSRDWPSTLDAPAASGGVDGCWNCVQNPSMNLILSAPSDQWGYLTGTLTIDGNASRVVGFTDSDALNARLARQGLTLTTLLPQSHAAVTLVGSLGFASDSLSLAWIASRGTSARTIWSQTRFEGLDFCRC